MIAVRLEAGDVGEDEAAHSLGEAVAGERVTVEGPSPAAPTCIAGRPGVLVVEARAIDRINAVDEAITSATLVAYKPVVPAR